MLVLSRKRDEQIVLDGNIIITIVDIRGDKVRLGIDAPADVPVHRQEVYDAIQRHNAETSAAETSAAQPGPQRGAPLTPDDEKLDKQTQEPTAD